MKKIIVALLYLWVVVFGSNLAFAEKLCDESCVQDHSSQELKNFDQVSNIESGKIFKSDNDDAQYRYLKLKNQMQVLLISDAKADKAAAALDVFVGSAQDPKKRQGLAHFLEHMLFLGTDRYPEPDEYQAFISQHGGQHNAYTSFEHTNYFFDINTKDFEPALDRFSRFFVAPLFNEKYVEREKNAVHSEYKARITNDYRRQRDVFSQVINPVHPAAKFNVGNLDTLADTPDSKVRDDLLTFYKQYYSANQMALVVLAPNSLDELETLVRERFESVPNHHSSQPKHGQPLFTAGALPLLLSEIPVKELRTLSVTIPLPPVQQYYREKPLSYIANLIGHEGKGSLLSLLKEKGFAESLGAGEGLSDTSGSSFDITVGLTPAGLAKWHEVLALIFEEIKIVSEQGIAQWRQREQGALADIQFRYKGQGDPVNRVSQLASQLQKYPYKEALRGPYLMDRFDGDLIKKMLSAMKPSNSLVTLVAPELDTDRVSLWYQAPYKVTPLPALSLEGSSSTIHSVALTLPEVNAFVPESFALKVPVQKSTNKIVERGVPVLAVDQKNYRLWHYLDNYYEIPKAQLYVAIKTPAIHSAADAAMADLYLKLVTEGLNESSYSAALAGLGFSVNRRSDGVGFVVSGFDSKLSVLVSNIADELLSPSYASEMTSIEADELIERLRQDLIRQWRNGAKDTPYQQLLRETDMLLNTTAWSPRQLANALESFDRQRFNQFVAQLYQGASLELLASGNILVSEAKTMAQGMADRFANKPFKPWLNRGVVTVPEGEKLQSHMGIDHKDSALLRYYQGRDDSVEETAAMMVLRQLLRADFFHQLRTEQQRGYVVAVVDRSMDQVPGFGFLVQSPSVPVPEIAQAIDQFVLNYKEQLNNMTPEEFSRHREAVLTGLREKPKSLAEQSARYWGSIDIRDYNFNRRKQIIARVEATSLEQLKKIYQTVMVEFGYSLQVDSDDGQPLSGSDIREKYSAYQLPSDAR